MTGRQLYKIAAFFLIGVMLFIPIQEVFIPEYNYNENCEKAISGFHALEDNTVDAVFLGTSLVDCGVSPMKIYEDAGICTYNLGTSSQSIETSFFLLKEAFEKQNLKAVFLDPSSFFYEKADQTTNFFYRIVMSNLYGTKTGLEMALEYGNIAGNEGIASAVFPMILYHSRWDELTSDDLRVYRDRIYYSMGYYMMPYSLPVSEDAFEIYESHLRQYEMEYQTDPGLELQDSVHQFFPKIVELCEKNNAKLIVMKIPTFASSRYGGWNHLKSDFVQKYVETYHVTYLDMMYNGIVDFSQDTFDGRHLNIWGAEKVSAFLGKYLVDHFDDLNQGVNPVYEKALEKYRLIRDVCMIQTERDFYKYLQTLSRNLNRWSVVITTGADFHQGLCEEDFLLLCDLGLEQIQNVEAHETYAAIIEDGNELIELSSDAKLNETRTILDKKLDLCAVNQYDVVVEGGLASITVDGVQHLATPHGIGILVWDRENDLPVDSKVFDTRRESKDASSLRSKITQDLRVYEDEVCAIK